MSAATPAGVSYAIDRGSVHPGPPDAAELCRQAELLVHWRTADACTSAVSSVGWLQPDAPELAIAGSAAQQWLQQDAPATALAAARDQGLKAVLLSAEAADSALSRNAAEQGIAVGVLEAGSSPAAALWQLRECLMTAAAGCQTVYGVLAEVFDLGVLIVGPAGVGKSELALELLARGHQLVADDVVEVRRLPGDFLCGSAPLLLQGFLEVRGLGVLDVARMFGEDALGTRRRVDFLLELLPVRDAPTDYRARLAGLRGEEKLLELPLPTICLPIRVGHNLATLVEAACRDQWLRLQGYCAEDAFAQRQQRAIDAQTDAP